MRVGCRTVPLARLALLLVTLLSVASAGVAQSVASRDRDADRAQRDFERFRHMRLPATWGGHAACEERVGRFCYWLDPAGDWPTEPPEVPAARRRLLESLAAAQERDPTNGWAVGQRVRYLLEEGDAAGAVAASHACAAEEWWCATLLGASLHAAERIDEASRAFDDALRTMPERERCRYTDVAPWLEGNERGAFARLPCPSPRRDSIAEALWRRADPFGGREVSEARVVFLARRASAALLASAARPDEMRWGDDMEELGMRYGFASRWAIEHSRSATDPFPTVVSHEPRHALPFSPTGRAVARFPVAGADTVLDLAPRATRFRRGDSLLVVVAYDASVLVDSSGEARSVRAAAALIGADRQGVHSIADRTAGAGTFVLRGRNVSGSLYVDAIDSASRRAARGQATVVALDSGGALSDLLLVHAARVAGRADLPLDSIVDAADSRDAIRVGDPVGIFWESYRAPLEDDSLRVELRVVPTNLSLAARLASALRLRELPAPSTITWSSAGRAGVGEGHALVLDTSGLPPGTYRLELWLRGRGPDATATASLRIVR